jgi:hypothetical protein
LCKFPKPWYIQKSNFIRKRIFLTFGPTGPAASQPIRTFGPAVAHFFPFQPAVPPPPHWASASRPAQLTSRPNRPPSSSSRTGAKRTRRHRRPASRRPHDRPRRPPPEEKKWPHQSRFIPPLIGATPSLQTPITGAFKSGPLKLLQRRPLKALGLPCHPSTL